VGEAHAAGGRRRRALLPLAVVGVAVAAAACSNSTTGSGQAADVPGSTRPGQAGTAAAAEKPKFASEYERTCSDGLGFGGVPAYSRTARGVHPAVLLTKEGSPTWTQQVPFDGYPKGWLIGYTDDAAKAQLIVCYERTSAVPAGKTCQMKDDKTNQQFTLTMYNTQYRLRVLEARTGKVLSEKVGQAKSTDCPTIAYVGSDEDRTKYYTDASPTDYRGTVKQFVAP
jgi:hypothetical protein